MKHAYRPICQCHRCFAERARRTQQGTSNHVVRTIHATLIRAERKRSRRPVVGSQEWAETRGDDLGDSPDY